MQLLLPEVSPFLVYGLSPNRDLTEKGGSRGAQNTGASTVRGVPLIFQTCQVVCPQVCTCGKVAQSQVMTPNKDIVWAQGFPNLGLSFLPVPVFKDCR